MLNRNILMPLLGAASLFLSWPVLADSEDKSIPAQEQVIQPQLDRREVKVPHINADDIEVGFYSGILSIENFSSQSVKGLRLAYHVTEDFFIEGVKAKSIISD